MDTEEIEEIVLIGGDRIDGTVQLGDDAAQ